MNSWVCWRWVGCHLIIVTSIALPALVAHLAGKVGVTSHIVLQTHRLA